jgi:hypothetical protein
MVFSATFNNISAISWRSFLLAEETGVTFGYAFSENILEIGHPKTRIAYGSHVCQWIRTNEQSL